MEPEDITSPIDDILDPGGGDDTVAPVLTSLALPSTIDLSSGPVDFEIAAEATDVGLGVQQVIVWFDRPVIHSVLPGSTDYQSGSLLGLFGILDGWSDGAATRVFGLSPDNAPGILGIDRVTISDLAGNDRVYAAAELEALGVDTTIEVTGSVGDTTPPELTSLVFPSVVDLTSGTAAFDVVAVVSDDDSGVDDLVISLDRDILRSPGPEFGSFEARDFFGLFGTSIDWGDGTGSEDFGLSPDNAPGLYSIESVQITDLAGNERVYTAAELAALGIGTTIELTGPAPNSPPSGEVLVLGTPLEGETLTADASALEDADTLGALSYSWLRDGAPIPGAEGATYTLTGADVGALLSVEISYTEGGGTQESVESAATAAVAPLGLLIEGTPGPDELAGTAGADTILAAGAEDTIAGGAGDDSIDGGEGADTAVFSGPRALYTVTLSPNGAVVEDRRADGDGADALTEVETLGFLDDDWELVQFAGVADLDEDAFRDFVEVYIAYFNRAPDAEGLFFYGSAFAGGTSLAEAASTFLDSEEYGQTFPAGLSNLDFARTVYTNVLGRDADPLGLEFWVGVLDRGEVGRDVFILEVLEGAKAPPPDGATQDFIDLKADDVAYLKGKTDLGIHFAVTRGLNDVDEARVAMDLFDGTEASVTAALQAIDSAHAAALDPDDGGFLLPLVGVLDDPFAVA